jgi:hypothetical protein
MFLHNLLIESLAQAWRLLAAPPSTLLEKITWRKVVFFAALLVAAAALAQIASLDMAFFVAGDIAFYCEIASALMFVVVRGHIRQSVHTAKLALTHTIRRARIWWRHSMRARHRRNTKHPTARDTGTDDDGGWLPELGEVALQS